jgi:hypothetical protein
MTNRRKTSVEEAETLALEALASLAADPEQFADFLAMSGLTAGDIAASAASRDFLAGLLDHVTRHEPALMRLCEEKRLEPFDVFLAIKALDPSYDLDQAAASAAASGARRRKAIKPVDVR